MQILTELIREEQHSYIPAAYISESLENSSHYMKHVSHVLTHLFKDTVGALCTSPAEKTTLRKRFSFYKLTHSCSRCRRARCNKMRNAKSFSEMESVLSNL